MRATERRCKNGDIVIVSDTPFHRHFEVRTTYPLAECLNQQFFINQFTWFRRGDRINILRFSTDDWDGKNCELLEGIEGVRVAHADRNGVDLRLMYAPLSFKETAEPGITVCRGFAGKFAVRVDGAIEATRNTVVEAREYAEQRGRELGKEVVDLTVKKAA